MAIETMARRTGRRPGRWTRRWAKLALGLPMLCIFGLQGMIGPAEGSGTSASSGAGRYAVAAAGAMTDRLGRDAAAGAQGGTRGLSRPLVTHAERRVILYDGSRNTGTPDTQGFLYLARAQTPPLMARQSFVDGVATLDSSAQRGDSAGWFGRADRMPVLERQAGFTVTFTVRLDAEDHTGSDKNGDSIGDRAGLSVIVLAADSMGIELGFWPGEIWAQEDGAAEPPPPTNTLFTHAEGAAWNTGAALTPYDLRIRGEGYALFSAGRPVLGGRLRDYRAFGQFPYTSRNFLFLGDDTTSAGGTMALSQVAIMLPDKGEGGTPTATMTAVPTATVEATATEVATATEAATATATVGASATPGVEPTSGATASATDEGPTVALAGLFLPLLQGGR